MIVFSSVIWH